jgi:hypothetical protein
VTSATRTNGPDPAGAGMTTPRRGAREALDGELSYDKRMLDRWFAERFGAAR